MREQWRRGGRYARRPTSRCARPADSHAMPRLGSSAGGDRCRDDGKQAALLERAERRGGVFPPREVQRAAAGPGFVVGGRGGIRGYRVVRQVEEVERQRSALEAVVAVALVAWHLA